VSLRLPLRVSGPAGRASAARQAGPAGPVSPAPPGRRRIPGRFWVYAGFILLYGICETMNGNWSQLEMTTRLGASKAQASMALAAFWGMVTAGRVLFALIDRWLPARITYHLLPVVMAAAFVLIDVLPAGAAVAGIAVFGLAGLGCSALLPLTISFGEEELTAISAAVAGGIIAFYQLGYGVAAFGVGPLQHAGLSLSAIFGGTAAVAVLLVVLSFVVSPPRRRSSRPAGLAAGGPLAGHPAPGAITPQG
jgi:fucose permease